MGSGRSRAVNVALWVALLSLVAVVSIQKTHSSDYFWQLRAGQLIVETGSVPSEDPFSFSATGSRWIDIHWLFQVALYAVYQLGGHVGVSVSKLVCIVATLACLGLIGFRRERVFVTVLALSLLLLSGGDRFMARPELLSFLFLAAELALFERFRKRPERWIFAVVGIQLVWVNLHGLFALGLVLCGIHLAVEIAAAWGGPREPGRWQRCSTLAWVTALSLMASLLNPNGVLGLLYPLQQLQMLGSVGSASDFSLLIRELVPPFHPNSQMMALDLAFPLALAILSGGSMLLNRRRFCLSDVLVWGAFGYLALSAQRNITLFAIVAAPIAIRNANEFLDDRAVLSNSRALWGLLVAGAVGFVALDIAQDRFYARLGGFRETGFGIMETVYPIGAAEWVARAKPPGPIYHKLAFGGYLMWRLYPEYQTLLDGRLEVFGLRRLVRLSAKDVDSFRRIDAKFHFGVAILAHNGKAPLHHQMYVDPHWRLEFVDDVSAVFVRVSKEWSPPVPALDVDGPNLFGPIAEPGSSQGVRRLLNRVIFYTSMKRFPKALELLDEVIRLRPDQKGAQRFRAKLLKAIPRTHLEEPSRHQSDSS